MTAPLELPKLVLGTMTFGDTVDISGAGSMLDAALGAGISHIDTANGYAGGELSTAIVSSPLAAIYGAFCGHGFSPRT
ncbi:aldo/keto reductase, partial [Rhodococcus erythropolis]